MKAKISKKKAAKTMSKRSCGYWNCGYELRRDWVSKKFGFPEKKEAYEALREQQLSLKKVEHSGTHLMKST